MLEERVFAPGHSPIPPAVPGGVDTESCGVVEKGRRGSLRITSPPSHVMGDGKGFRESPRPLGKPSDSAGCLQKKFRRARGRINIKSRFLAAGICFPDHLFHKPTKPWACLQTRHQAGNPLPSVVYDMLIVTCDCPCERSARSRPGTWRPHDK